MPPSSGHCNTAAAILQLKRASVCLPSLQLASHVSTPKTPMIKNFNKITIYIAVCGLIVKLQLIKIFYFPKKRPMSLDFINNILTKYVKNAKCDNLIGEVK